MPRKNEIVVFTCGEYDDYQIWCVARAKQNFSMSDEKKLFAPIAKEKIDGWLAEYESEDTAMTDAFVDYLKEKDLIDDFNCREVWCASYGEFDTKLNRDRII